MAPPIDREASRMDPTAQALAEGRLYLADALAWKEYRRCGRVVPLEELIGEARLALAYAARLYDETKGVPFGAYATLVIRHRLCQTVNTWRQGGRSTEVHFTDLSRTRECAAAAFDPPCPLSQGPEQQAIVGELQDQLRRSLPPRWFLLLQLYFVQEHTMEEIGAKLGISRERVRQLLDKAIERARSHCSSRQDIT